MKEWCKIFVVDGLQVLIVADDTDEAEPSLVYTIDFEGVCRATNTLLLREGADTIEALRQMDEEAAGELLAAVRKELAPLLAADPPLTPP